MPPFRGENTARPFQIEELPTSWPSSKIKHVQDIFLKKQTDAPNIMKLVLKSVISTDTHLKFSYNAVT